MPFWKRLPSKFANRRVLVTSRSYRRYLTQSLEYIHGDLFAAVERWVTPGAVVWDIGANLGIFSFAAAIRTGAEGRVYAFEADVATAALLTRSLGEAKPGEAKICVCPWAMGDREGEACFSISSYRTAASALAGFGRFGEDARGVTLTVPMRTVDSLVPSFQPPSLIKIDVEGAENLVLRGAQEVIQRYRPTLLVEGSGGELGTETAELLRSWGYVWGSWAKAGALGNSSPCVNEDIAAVWADRSVPVMAGCLPRITQDLLHALVPSGTELPMAFLKRIHPSE